MVGRDTAATFVFATLERWHHSGTHRSRRSCEGSGTHYRVAFNERLSHPTQIALHSDAAIVSFAQACDTLCSL
jgi:hypothetical protein